MAKSYYKVNTTKKIITVNDNVTPTKNELEDLKIYVAGGYIIKHTTSVSIADMRAEMKDDKETLDKFNAAYAEKNGFHNALKIYSAWNKARKAAEKKAKAE